MSTAAELAGFAVLAATAWSFNHLVGGAVAGVELLLIGYATEGVTVDLRGLVSRLKKAKNVDPPKA